MVCPSNNVCSNGSCQVAFDAGTNGIDSGVLMPDSGVTAADSGTLATDSGIRDGGTTVVDSGVGDSGVVMVDGGSVVTCAPSVVISQIYGAVAKRTG
jgi:hypothetical protein